MPFKLALVLAGLVPAFFGTLVYDGMFGGNVKRDILPAFVHACALPKFQPRLLYETACQLDAVFRQLAADKVGRATIILVCLNIAPTTLWVFLQGGKSGRSPLLSPLVPALVVAGGQLYGIGVLSPVVFPAVFALVKILEPAKVGLPAPPTQAYVLTAFFLHIFILATVFGLAFLDSTHPYWSILNWTFQFSPLVFFSLALFPTPRPPKSDLPEATRLFSYLRPPLMITYWVALAYGLYGKFVDRNTPTMAGTMIFYDNLGAITVFLGLWLVDVANGDAKFSKPLQIATAALVQGPPAAMCLYYEAKEKQGAKRAKVLNKTR